MVSDPDVIARMQNRGAFGRETDPVEYCELMGIPEFGRIEIGLRDRYAFRDIAELLRGLADRLEGISKDPNTPDHLALSAGLHAIRGHQTMIKEKGRSIRERIASRSKITSISGG